MNCATTCSTGPCRRPAHSKISCKEPRFEETDQVWTEAGFLPPADYRRAVALLHRLAMDGETATSLLSSVLTVAAETSARGYRILDPAKLRRIAEEYGIEPAGRNDTEIAHAVTLAIIGEYGASTPEEHA